MVDLLTPTAAALIGCTRLLLHVARNMEATLRAEWLLIR
jgi:hypothetical protein